jgi:hypothetical protein
MLASRPILDFVASSILGKSCAVPSPLGNDLAARIPYHDRSNPCEAVRTFEPEVGGIIDREDRPVEGTILPFLSVKKLKCVKASSM